MTVLNITHSPSKPIVVLWWNTSLSPLGVSRESVEDKKYVFGLLAKLRKELSVDIIGLGEVCTADIEEILEEIGDPDLHFHDATGKLGNNKFDTALIYDRTRFVPISNGRILDSYGSTTLKVGEKIELLNKESNTHIDFFISHWPSRMYHGEFDSKRFEIGTAFRKYIDEIRLTNPLNKYIVLMGDFNDDPFSPSLYKHLLATRDRELATKNDSYLYNPFWRKLGESDFIVHNNNENICGTYFYATGMESKWFNFDQIIFSSAFLKKGILKLNEEKCFIFKNDNLVSRIKNSKETLDHLPVLGVIDIGELL